MFGNFAGTWTDPRGVRVTISGNDGTVQVQYPDVRRGPFPGEEVDTGTPASINVRFTDVNELIQGVLQDAGQSIAWSNGTVWTKQIPRPIVFMFQPTRFEVVTGDKLQHWAQLMRERVGLNATLVNAVGTETVSYDPAGNEVD